MTQGDRTPQILETKPSYTVQILLGVIIVLSFAAFIVVATDRPVNLVLAILTGLAFAVALAALIVTIINVGNTRARQTTVILNFARQMLSSVVDQGLTPQSAKRIVRLLVPTERVAAVAITEGEELLSSRVRPTHHAHVAHCEVFLGDDFGAIIGR